MRQLISLVLAVGLIVSLAPAPVAAEEIWDGPMMTFTRADNVDGTLPENQDQITGAVWIARLTGGGSIWNALFDPMANFTPCDGPYPSDTEWAFGDIADYQTLNYGPFLSETFAACFPCYNLNPSLPGVLHLISEDIYIPIQFNSWTCGGPGGFSYDRGTPGTVGTENSSLSSVKALYK